jgi:hypothetical protein
MAGPVKSVVRFYSEAVFEAAGDRLVRPAGLRLTRIIGPIACDFRIDHLACRDEHMHALRRDFPLRDERSSW